MLIAFLSPLAEDHDVICKHESLHLLITEDNRVTLIIILIRMIIDEEVEDERRQDTYLLNAHGCGKGLGPGSDLRTILHTFGYLNTFLSIFKNKFHQFDILRGVCGAMLFCPLYQMLF